MPEPTTGDILDRARRGERITEAEALHLFEHAELIDLSPAAQSVRERLNGPRKVSYVVDRNVNYTNVCTINCTFCAFHRRAGAQDAYVLSKEELERKAEETRTVGGTGFLLQGGVNESLPWEYYLDLLDFLNRKLGLWVHGFSPVEIQKMTRLNGLSLKETLRALREAGLGSLPGGGAEILADRVRKKIAPRKGDARSWLDVMDAAHDVGLLTTGTMMFGITETLGERVEHLRVLREQQDRALRKGSEGHHTSFTAWPFQSSGTSWDGKVPKPTAFDYLKTIAISRIYLDNFQHIQSSWVTMGRKVGQLALHYGCDDMGSLMLEENVVSSAGTRYTVDRPEMIRMIQGAGYEPWQRDNSYGPVAL